jgi:ribonucleotide reductase alpha subunit
MSMLDENALLVLKKRYLIKNEEGEPVETPDGLFTRVASRPVSFIKAFNMILSCGTEQVC